MNWFLKAMRRRRLEKDLADEIAFHRIMRADDTDAPPFGNEGRVRERVRETWTLGWVETTSRDVLYALRSFRRNPGFVLTAIVTLALGIGANTAIFSVVHSVLLKDLPVVDAKSLVRVGDNEGDGCCYLSLSGNGPDYSIFSTDGYKYLRDHTPEMEELAAMQAGLLDLSVRRASGESTPHSSLGELVSGNYFQTFGLQPQAGRLLTVKDDGDGAAPVAVLSYRTWQKDYAGDPSVIGSTLVMNTHPVTVIGVAPKPFYGDRMTTNPPDFYLPLSQEPALGAYHVLNSPKIGWLFLIGRVKPGTEMGPLAAKMSSLLRQSLSQVPDFQTQHGKEILTKTHVVLTPGGQGIANMQHEAGSSLHLLMGIAGFVLLIACANIANLTLVRGLARRTEISVRMALGAARMRIVRQMITESVALACLGGIAGTGLAYAGTRALLALMFPNSPDLPIDAMPSLPVLGFAFGVSLLTGLVFGIAPAWITSREQPIHAMRGANRATKDVSSLLQRSLVILQTAVCLVLLVVAGLLGKSLENLQHEKLGLEPQNRVIVRMNPLKAGYKPEQLAGLYQAIEDKFHAMPGVEHVGLTMYTPLGGTNWSTWVFAQGQRAPDPGHYVDASFNRASPEYFEAVGQRVIRGRTFTDSDTATSAGVVVVNEALVKKLFKPGVNPLGQHIGASELKSAGDFEIVGVVEDSKYRSAREPSPPMYFLPMLQQSRTNPPKDLDSSIYAGALVLQMKSVPTGLESQVRKTLASIDPNLTVDGYQMFEAQIDATFNDTRMISRLTSLFGLLALILASVGIYGVTSYTVERRGAEIGVRMALGAKRGDVLRMILRGALMQTGVGLAIGVPVALLCVKLVKTQLYGVAAQDVGVFSATTLILALAAVIAGAVPARRAASTDPMKALRME